VSVVSRYLEEEGIATTHVSLVREHSEAIRPPRALWVPFMLGRPLGAPGDPDFQRNVLRATLALLEEPSGPVLRDFAVEAPQAEDDVAGSLACPVHFERPAASSGGEGGLLHQLQQEIAQLRPWHDLSVQRRSASTVGISGSSPEEGAGFLLAFVEGRAASSHRAGQPLGVALKHVCDDLRAYYEEAAGAQPDALGVRAMERWLYSGTVLGQALIAVWRKGRDSDDESVRIFAQRLLLPKAVLHRLQSEGK
jgi:hypothetical protein